MTCRFGPRRDAIVCTGRGPRGAQLTRRSAERAARIVLGTNESIAGTVYGTIVVMGAIVAGAHGVGDLWRLDVIVDRTVLVLWFAHVYAHGLGESIGLRPPARPCGVRLRGAARAAIALAAVGPVVALSLGALEVLRGVAGGLARPGDRALHPRGAGVPVRRARGAGSRWGTVVSVALTSGWGS